MTHLRPETLSQDEFRGFDEARTIMRNYEDRERVHARIDHETPFLADGTVAAVHVDNVSRAGQAALTAFDRTGRAMGTDTLCVDEPDERLDVAPEFDHNVTKMPVPVNSELQRVVGLAGGWVVDMEALREHDPLADRRATQRAVFLAHLADLMASGHARGFLLDRIPDDASGQRPGASEVA